MKRSIRNIVFDLGSVIMDIEISRTVEAFERLGYNSDVVKDDNSYMEVFQQFEKGEADIDSFVRALQAQLGSGTAEQDIKDAWNAMVIGFKKEKIDFLKQLAGKYRLFLLSNSNLMHEQFFGDILDREFGTSLDDLFEKLYYSHRLGLAKPDAAIYRHVLEDSGLEPSETLFVDDKKENIEGAEKLGIKGMLFPENGELSTVLDYLK